MPITKSAKKALKQNDTKHSRNRRFVALYKEVLKSFERALKTGNVEEATKLLTSVYSSVDKLVKKNIIHVNNAARKKSAFAKTLKSVSAK